MTVQLKRPSRTTKLSARIALFEALDVRRLMSATLTGVTTYSINAETNSAYGPNSFIAVSGSANGSGAAARTRDWALIEYNSSSAVFPNKAGNTFQVSDIDDLTLSLNNTATTGTYAPTAGNFSVFFAPDDASDPTAIRWQAADTLHGLNGQLGTSAQTQIGTASFTGAAGYTDYTFSSLSSAVKQGIVNDLNNNTPIRFAIVPETTNFFADWEGNFTSKQPKLTMNVEQAAVQPAQIAFDSTAYSVDKTAGTASFTVTRAIGSGFTDAGSTVAYATSNGSAIAGTNYAAASGTITFAAGETSKTITIPITNVTPQGGDKTFTLTLSNPGPAGQTTVQTPSAKVTIVDTDAVNLSQNSVDNAIVQPGGPKTGTNGKSYFNVEGSGNGVNASYGVLDYNIPGSGLEYVLPAGQHISTVNSLTFDTVAGFPIQAYYASGPINVYLVSDVDSSIQADGTSPLAFDYSVSPDGLGAQLGTKQLLGTISYDRNQMTDVFTSYALTGGDPAALQTLVADINGGLHFRLAVTPGNDTVAAGWEGQHTFNSEYEAPKLSLNAYTSSAVALPAWLATGSQATWDASSKTLNVTGNATIIADPGSDNPIITESGAAAHLAFTSTAGGATRYHLGGLTLSGGASADVSSIGAAASFNNRSLVSIDASHFAVDASSKLNLENNDLVLRSATGSTATTVAASLAAGFAGGAWNGSGINSSTAAADSHFALGMVMNGTTRTTFGPGESVAATDLLVGFTRKGDGNLDGAVNFNDLVALAQHYNLASGATWSNGDSNYDGHVDFNDLVSLAQNYNTTLVAPVVTLRSASVAKGPAKVSQADSIIA